MADPDKTDDFIADPHVDLDAGEFGGAMTDADYYDRISTPEAARDEVLEAGVRDQYRSLGLDEDSIAEAISAAREAGMFDIRG